MQISHHPCQKEKRNRRRYITFYTRLLSNQLYRKKAPITVRDPIDRDHLELRFFASIGLACPLRLPNISVNSTQRSTEHQSIRIKSTQAQVSKMRIVSIIWSSILWSSSWAVAFQLPQTSDFIKHPRHLSTTNPVVATTNFRKLHCKTYTSTQLSVVSQTSTMMVPLENAALLGPLYMVCLALQYGCQPILAKNFAPKTMVKGTFTFMQDITRIITSVALLIATQSWGHAVHGWTWQSAWAAAGIPAFLYATQNYLSLQAYQNLSPITFNVLNQTKTLSSALFCFLVLGQKQSLMQVFSLMVLLLSGLVMQSVVPLPFLPKTSDPTDDLKHDAAESEAKWGTGILSVLAASLLSGMAGAFVQRSLQLQQRNSLLFSLELATMSSLCNLSNLLIPWTPDGRQCREQGLLNSWRWTCFLPILTNTAGGILVGMVTKYSGSVKKGFALIMGIFLSGFLQNWFGESQDQVTSAQWAGGVLAAISFLLYTSFPSK